MARLNLAPTKSSLLKVKEQMVLAEEGRDLLEQKREILVRELMALLKEAQSLEDRFQARARTAYLALGKSLATQGRTEAALLAGTAVYDWGLEPEIVSKAGMTFPTVRLRVPETVPWFTRGPGAAAGDRTMVEFKELTALAVPLAALGTQVRRLARELKKTQRRVNALDKIVLPQVKETWAYIETALEEKDREAFFVGKLLKRRLGAGT